MRPTLFLSALRGRHSVIYPLEARHFRSSLHALCGSDFSRELAPSVQFHRAASLSWLIRRQASEPLFQACSQHHTAEGRRLGVRKFADTPFSLATGVQDTDMRVLIFMALDAKNLIEHICIHVVA